MLFKILHGDKARISTDITPYHEGYCYVTYNGDFYVDMNNERVKLNAKDCETLMGVSLDELRAEFASQDVVILREAQSYTDAALETATTQDAVVLHEAQTYTDNQIASLGSLATKDKIEQSDLAFELPSGTDGYTKAEVETLINEATAGYTSEESETGFEGYENDITIQGNGVWIYGGSNGVYIGTGDSTTIEGVLNVSGQDGVQINTNDEWHNVATESYINAQISALKDEIKAYINEVFLNGAW